MISMDEKLRMDEATLAYISKFENLNYDKFKQMAIDCSLLPCEKVGFPDIYREGKEHLIWHDIKSKLTNLNLSKKLILDIGPGCSQLPRLLLEQAGGNDSKVLFCDSQEMLSQLPDSHYIEKIEGPFPACWDKFTTYTGAVDTIIVYSVLHYIFIEANMWNFLDCCLELLNHGGQLLLGDLPNNSKRQRFFESPKGIDFHQQYTATNTLPQTQTSSIGKLDDSVIMSLLMRARSQGFDSYVLPQADNLPMANRREDILIVRP
jgi:2-polyprenyl-3-methyl-5-hydroxy-6-metoxy-1,4-benzoquinol methylase